MDGEFSGVVTQRVQPGKEAACEALLRELELATIANDKGCLRYEWYRASTPRTFILLECWTDLQAVRAHLGASHMDSIMQKLKQLAAEEFTFVGLTKL